jgi:rhodanese-related sulfurtransferase
MAVSVRLCWLAVGLLIWSAVFAAEPGISPPDLAARMQMANPPLVVDVRSVAEYRSGHLAGAINIAHDEIRRRWPALNVGRDDEVILYCGTGRRACMAQQTLEAQGYTHTRVLEGGFEAWAKAGLPVIKESSGTSSNPG